MKCPKCTNTLRFVLLKEKLVCPNCKAQLFSRNHKKLQGYGTFSWMALMFYCLKEFRLGQLSEIEVTSIAILGSVLYVLVIQIYSKYE